MIHGLSDGHQLFFDGSECGSVVGVLGPGQPHYLESKWNWNFLSHLQNEITRGGGTHIECFADLEGYYTNLETAIKGRDGIICVKSLKNPQIMISQQKTQNSHIVRFGGELSVVEKLFD